jgi:hypothetical protein
MKTRALIGAGALSLALALGVGCGTKEDRWADAGAKAQQNQKEGTATTYKVTKAGTFNKFFPKDGVDGLKLIPAADKDGYAEYKAEKDGKEVGRLSIDDADEKEKGKYKAATEKVAGYPYHQLGANKSSILVADKYQVSITSASGGLDAAARKALFEKFDLGALSRL